MHAPEAPGAGPTLSALADALAPALDAARHAREGDPAGVWIASERPVRRLGLRLDAGRPPYAWAEGLDAVVVHRPFGLWPARLPERLGVLAYHRSLDESLAIGSTALADALGLTLDAEPLRRDEREVGRVGTLPDPAPLAAVLDRLDGEFRGHEEALGTDEDRPVARVALMNAMTDALVRDAARRGAGLYLTGQVRGPGRAAVAATGLAVLAVGQDRAEAWGLREIGRRLRARWPALEVVDQTGVERPDADEDSAA